VSGVAIRFCWNNETFLVSEVVADVIEEQLNVKATGGESDGFTAELAQRVDERLGIIALESDDPATTLRDLRRELYVYSMFEGDQRMSEMTWLSSQIGQLAEVVPIAHAGVGWRKLHKNRTA
jgi:hypothetical protein